MLREAVALHGSPSRLTVRPGWFQDTLEPALEEIGPIAILHLDGDWYESVLFPLETLYPLVSPGGWIVIDDYGAVAGAARATEEFRARIGERSPLVRTDQTGRYWRKPA
jgi:O-methyltransferase